MPEVKRTRPIQPTAVRIRPRLCSGAGSTGSPGRPYTLGIDRSEAKLPAVVRLRSAVCLLGRFPALAGVDLDVEPGEIVLLSGPNGAGKTTLLRLVAGLVPLYSGEGEVFGTDLAVDRRSARRNLALVGHETF